MELQSKESEINDSTLPFASRGNCHPLLPNDINQRPGGILSLYMSICRTECAIHRGSLRAFLEKPVLWLRGYSRPRSHLHPIVSLRRLP